MNSLSRIISRSIHITAMASGKRALIVLAEEAEEMEVVIPSDLLRRSGIDVTIAGLKDAEPVTCAKQLVIKPDKSFCDAAKSGPYDLVFLPGGPGAKKLGQCSELGKFLQEHEKRNGLIAAICHGPVALKEHGIAKGKNMTVYPPAKDDLGGDYNYTGKPVEVDGNVVTSQAPGTAFEFVMKLVEMLVGAEKKNEVMKQMLIKL